MAYHHFASISEKTKTLAFFLKPGGALIVVDFQKQNLTKEDPPGSAASESPDTVIKLGHDLGGATEEKMKEIVAHVSGFGEEEIRGAFEGAGLTSFSHENIVKARLGGFLDVKIFLAKGVKPV